MLQLLAGDHLEVHLPASIDVGLGQPLLAFAVLIFLQMEHIHLGQMGALLLGVWSNDYSEEWQTLPFKVNLLRDVGLEVLDGWIDVEDRVAVVPPKLLDAISIHLLLNPNLLLVRHLAVLQSHGWVSYA